MLFDEPAAGQVERLFRDGLDVRVSAVSLGEVVDVLARRGINDEGIEYRLDLFDSAGLTIILADAAEARFAGKTRAHYWDRDFCAVSLADCFVIAAAKMLGARVATSDRSLIAIAAGETVQAIALPDSKGHRPDVTRLSGAASPEESDL